MPDTDGLSEVSPEEWELTQHKPISDKPDGGAERVALDGLRRVAREILQTYGSVDDSTIYRHYELKGIEISREDAELIIMLLKGKNNLSM